MRYEIENPIDDPGDEDPRATAPVSSQTDRDMRSSSDLHRLAILASVVLVAASFGQTPDRPAPVLQPPGSSPSDAAPRSLVPAPGDVSRTIARLALSSLGHAAAIDTQSGRQATRLPVQPNGHSSIQAERQAPLPQERSAVLALPKKSQDRAHGADFDPTDATDLDLPGHARADRSSGREPSDVDAR